MPNTSRTTIALRGTAANVGAATELALLAFRDGDEARAAAFELIARDLTIMGRGIAWGTWKQSAIDSEAAAIYARWDALRDAEIAR